MSESKSTKLGRPSVARWETVVVADHASALAWSDGYFAGSREALAVARCFAAAHTSLSLPNGTVVTADSANPIGALAAMLAALGPDAQIVRYGVEVERVLSGHCSPHEAVLHEWNHLDEDVADLLFGSDVLIVENEAGDRKTVAFETSDDLGTTPTWDTLSGDDWDALQTLGMLPDGTPLPKPLPRQP